MSKFLRPRIIGLGLLTAMAMSVCTHSVCGQATIKVGSTEVTNLNTTPLSAPSLRSPITEIISPTSVPNTVNSLSNADPLGKCTIWLEYGDGSFTTRPISSHNLRTANATPFLMAVPLYDTSKGKDGTLSRYMTGGTLAGEGGSRGAQNANDTSRLQLEQLIKLTPNNYSIVPGEPLALAVTYKLPFAQTVTSAPPKYYALLYYNSNNKNAFQPLSGSSNLPLKYNENRGNVPTLPDIRLFDGQSLVTKQVDGLPAIPAGYTGAIVVQLDGQSGAGLERNLFVTLKALGSKTGLKIGDMTSIVTRLVSIRNGELSVLGSDTLTNMRVGLAFDPNHLTQLPTCLLLPKGNTPLQYKIQFQNLGKGPADSVKIVFRRPAGLNNASFVIQSAQYAGTNVALDGSGAKVTFKHQYDAGSNADIFWFIPVGADPSGKTMLLLRGTDEVTDANVNPLTMGEVNFTINTSPSVADNIKADADIYFHSFFASPKSNWEAAVTTNMAISTYKKKDCQCDNTCPPDSSCYIILGLCWWWWVLILLALLLLIGLLRRRRRS